MGSRTVRSIVEGHEPLTTHPETAVANAARLMRENECGAILVVRDEHLVGIFTERDALFRVIADGRDAQRTPVGDVMTRNPRAVNPDQTLERALELMYEGRFRHVPVVDHGRPIGVVSSRDAVGTELEEFMYTMIAEEQARDILA